MRRYMKYNIIAIILVIILTIGIIASSRKNRNQEDDGKFKIVTSFYPIYIMTANITQGANNIEVINMAETNVGCVHDYTLTTSDMKKIENADVLIQNGLGLESFIDKITTLNKNIQIIDSSEGILNLIKEESETNPHIWTSLAIYIQQVENIKEALVEKNPENAEIYQKNAEEYIKELSELKLKYELELQELNGKSAVILNESFEYLARDLRMDYTSIHTSHEESTISAETLKNVIDTMKQKNTQIIIIDMNDSSKNAEILQNETGAKIYKLDSGLTGSFSKDTYINSMNSNFDKLKDQE